MMAEVTVMPYAMQYIVVDFDGRRIADVSECPVPGCLHFIRQLEMKDEESYTGSEMGTHLEEAHAEWLAEFQEEHGLRLAYWHGSEEKS